MLTGHDVQRMQKMAFWSIWRIMLGGEVRMVYVQPVDELHDPPD
jgi:hypothetical protein